MSFLISSLRVQISLSLFTCSSRLPESGKFGSFPEIRVRLAEILCLFALIVEDTETPIIHIENQAARNSTTVVIINDVVFSKSHGCSKRRYFPGSSSLPVSNLTKSKGLRPPIFWLDRPVASIIGTAREIIEEYI